MFFNWVFFFWVLVLGILRFLGRCGDGTVVFVFAEGVCVLGFVFGVF